MNTIQEALHKLGTSAKIRESMEKRVIVEDDELDFDFEKENFFDDDEIEEIEKAEEKEEPAEEEAKEEEEHKCEFCEAFAALCKYVDFKCDDDKVKICAKDGDACVEIEIADEDKDLVKKLCTVCEEVEDAEEEKAEEQPEEEVKETEEVAEVEAPVEEVPAEEPAAEEAPVEEIAAEEEVKVEDEPKEEVEEDFPNAEKHELVDTYNGVEIYHCNKCGKYVAKVNGEKVKKDSIDELKACIDGNC